MHIVVTGIVNKKGKSAKFRERESQMGIEIPICQNINHNNKKYTYINKPVFVFIVILSSLKRKSW